MAKTTAAGFGIMGLLLLSGCASTPAPRASTPAPETVMITYHVKTGQEAALQDVLARAWAIYQQEHLVLAEPHVVVRGNENGEQPVYKEIFTWVSSAAPDNAPDSVKAIWGEMSSQCEARNGHDALEISQTELVVPKL
jgi:hypothetical protein